MACCGRVPAVWYQSPMISTSSEAPRTGRPRFQKLRVIYALIVREMGIKFGRSAGGYAWAIAEPLGGILLLSVAFSLALRSPPLGSSFILFYATGMIPFSMYGAMWKGVSKAISSNKGLLNYPVVSVTDALIAKATLDFMTVLLVGLLLFSGIILTLDLHVNLDLGAIALAFRLASSLGLGVGAMNCVLFGFFPTWKNVWAVLNRPLFILSGVLFLFEEAPPAFQKVLWWNPLFHVIGTMRDGFYGAYHPQYISLPYVFGLSLALLVTGGWLMRRHAAFLIEQ